MTFPSPFGVMDLKHSNPAPGREGTRFPSPFGVMDLKRLAQLDRDGRKAMFPSPFGVMDLKRGLLCGRALLAIC